MVDMKNIFIQWCSVKADCKSGIPYAMITYSHASRRGAVSLCFSMLFVFAKFLQQECLCKLTVTQKAASPCYRPNLSGEPFKMLVINA